MIKIQTFFYGHSRLILDNSKMHGGKFKNKFMISLIKSSEKMSNLYKHLIYRKFGYIYELIL